MVDGARLKVPLEGIWAGSPEMLRVCEAAERVASTDASIMLLGESGTGKELLARAVHRLSAYSNGRFVAINCAAIPDSLLESELFGYEKGAFTDAGQRTRGKIELAHEGTLFLDEIGDLPLSLQAKLLRFLQERTIERVGGRTEIPVNTRILCATHRDLQGMISEASFRQDLYYRLSEITFTIPPLRDRSGEVLLLAKRFLDQYSAELARPLRGFSHQALAALEEYDWPGNVRELENRVRRAVILCDKMEITPQDLELSGAKIPEESFKLRHVRRLAEERAVRKALAYCEGNISRAASLLGVSRPSLYDLMRKLGVT
ncbi:two component Fis family transcriptional regulator [Thioalkalivibrio sulfidiphilus HL-EbGr7]|uniref:Two component Fis family transcriptional regulator n=2 Tax=Thioalkalivibrio TaxID=106633 RepID=B8GVC7_THISH|nr:two component Fis family transcriptional regulator [Thioalkalivibrio sulfidiphilus HL-EbGr7]